MGGIETPCARTLTYTTEDWALSVRAPLHSHEMAVRIPSFRARPPRTTSDVGGGGAAAAGGVIMTCVRVPRFGPRIAPPTSVLKQSLDADVTVPGRHSKRGSDGSFSDEEREKLLQHHRSFRHDTGVFVNESLKLHNPDIMTARTVAQQPRKKPPPGAGGNIDDPTADVPAIVPAFPEHRMPEFDMGLVVDMDEEARSGTGLSDRTAGLSKLCVALATAPAEFFREVDGVLPDSAGIFASHTDVDTHNEGKIDPRKARAVALQLNNVLSQSVRFDVWRWRTPRVAVNAEVLRAFLSQRPQATEFVKHACTPNVSEIRARNLPTIPRSAWYVRPPIFDGEVPCARRAGCTVRLVGAVDWIGVADTCGLCRLCQCAEQTTVAMLLLAADPHIHPPTSACDLFFYREQCATDDDGYPAASMLISKSYPDAPFVPFRTHHYVIEYRILVPGGDPVPHVVRSKVTLPTPSSTPGFRLPLR